ncbi:MAG: TIGR00730 family Rossman fold protein [Actinomycetota bacterium]|nr:TIGR00730 family Rossman fold protein [Actinomycetota bacterium]
MPNRSFRRICVFCGSSFGARDTYRDAATGLASVLVERGIELVYGGGAVGLMGTVASAVMDGGGRVTGVIPRDLFDNEVPNAAITDLRYVDTMHERKTMMYDLSDAFVVLPGGLGTLEELAETATWAQIGIHDKPIGLLDVDGFFQPLLGFLRHAVDERFVKVENLDLLRVDHDPAALLDELALYERSQPDKWLDLDKI